MAKRFARLPGDAVGVLLPASVAADLVFFALHLAGKLPVMLNWTTGPANLAHAVETLGIRRVVTSRRLIDRLGIEVAGAEYVFLEDLRDRDRQAGSGCSPCSGRTSCPAGCCETLPPARSRRPGRGAVHLRLGERAQGRAAYHRNLITNVRASLDVLAVDRSRRDARLPAAVSQLRPDGQRDRAAAGRASASCTTPTRPTRPGWCESTAAYRATLLFTTPTFLSYMFGMATPDDLRSLRDHRHRRREVPRRRCSTRAENWRPRRRSSRATASPSARRWSRATGPGDVKPGTVGQPLDGVEVCVVDPDSNQPLPAGHDRAAAGPRAVDLRRLPELRRARPVRRGRRPPLVRTGDLVELDEERFIHFRGRLKRFLKAGGEMISLPALEEPLPRSATRPPKTARRWPSKGSKRPAAATSCCSPRRTSRCARPTPSWPKPASAA